MKVITEDKLREKREQLRSKEFSTKNSYELGLISDLILECQELDQLTASNDLDLILAAESYEKNYDGDERELIKTDVLNAFYHGSAYQLEKDRKQLTVTKLTPITENPTDDREVQAWYEEDGEYDYLIVRWHTGSGAFGFKEGDVGYWYDSDQTYPENDFIGWNDLPKYVPEESSKEDSNNV